VKHARPTDDFDWLRSGRLERYAILRSAIGTTWKNRKQRVAHPNEYAVMRRKFLAMRSAFDRADWPDWDHATKDFYLAIHSLREVYQARFAVAGNRSAVGAKKARENRKDRQIEAQDKKSYRAAACKIWEGEPMLPIGKVMERLGAKPYADSTLRGWIRDLSPTPVKPGRRRKASATP
jgi:hypothetical protein